MPTRAAGANAHSQRYRREPLPSPRIRSRHSRRARVPGIAYGRKSGVRRPRRSGRISTRAAWQSAHLRQRAHADRGREAAARGLPAIRGADHRVAAVRGGAAGGRPRSGPRRARVAVVVQRPRHHRVAEPPQGEGHRRHRGSPVGGGRRVGLEDAGAEWRGGLLHAGEKRSGRQAHEGGHRSVAEAVAPEGRFRDVQPSRTGRPDPHESVPVVRQDADSRRARRGREGDAEGARRLQLQGRTTPVEDHPERGTTRDRLLPAVSRARRRPALQRRRVLEVADPGEYRGHGPSERCGDLRRGGVRPAP